MFWYDDGYLIQQVSNANVDSGTAEFNSEYWFLLAATDEGSMLDGQRSDLVLHGG